MQNENAIILKKESTKSLELYHMFSKHGQQLTHVFKSRLGISSMAVNLLSMDPTNKTKTRSSANKHWESEHHSKYR